MQHCRENLATHHTIVCATTKYIVGVNSTAVHLVYIKALAAHDWLSAIPNLLVHRHPNFTRQLTREFSSLLLITMGTLLHDHATALALCCCQRHDNTSIGQHLCIRCCRLLHPQHGKRCFKLPDPFPSTQLVGDLGSKLHNYYTEITSQLNNPHTVYKSPRTPIQ